MFGLKQGRAHRFLHVVASPNNAEFGDRVDAGLSEWTAIDADFPLLTVELLARLGRIRTHIEKTLAPIYDNHHLTAAEFYVLATLARQTPEPQLGQAQLGESLGLTPGTVSVRVAQMVERNLVEVATGDKRSQIVTATPDALDRFDACRHELAFHQDRLFSTLDPKDRRTLGGLLRRLSIDYETEDEGGSRSYPPLGIDIEPAHLARHRRRAVGLPDVTGILVTRTTDPTPLEVGDLIVEVNREPVYSILDLVAEEPIKSISVVRGAQSIEIALDRHERPPRR